VVDITNFVMMDMGQPLHAFDAQYIQGAMLQVRRARSGEPFVSLDGSKIQLTSEDFVIADGSQALALAGIVGGQNSGIRDSTQDLILECACFRAAWVRRAARRHGVTTESGDRFSKGVNATQAEWALIKAAKLLTELCGAQPLGLVQVGRVPRESLSIEIHPSFVSQRLGYPVGESAVVAALEKVFCKVHKIEGRSDLLKVELPAHRQDLKIKEDLVEEVARIEGYDRIPYSLPLFGGAPLPHAKDFLLSSKVARVLVMQGALEQVSLALTDPVAEAQFWGNFDENSTAVFLKNPLSRELGALRRSLGFGLYRNLCYNVHQSQEEGFSFEVGQIFYKKDDRPEEKLNLAVCLWGEFCDPWDKTSKEPVVIRLKEKLLALAEALGVELQVRNGFSEKALSCYHPFQSGDIVSGDKKVGSIGALHPALLEKDKIRFPAALLELSLSDLSISSRPKLFVSELSHLPLVKRDLSFLVDQELSASELLQGLRVWVGQGSVSQELKIERVSLVDWFEGGPLPERKKSLSFRFEIQALRKTASELEIQAKMDEILNFCRERFKAELR
jgi:phenylalanyl-tRNA synthetase beta chain